MVRVGTGTSVEALEHDVKVLLFQSVRELLFNVIKHAGVKRASVRMSAGKGGAIEILVSDRGRGIDPVQAREGRNASMGFGLFRDPGAPRLCGWTDGGGEQARRRSSFPAGRAVAG